MDPKLENGQPTDDEILGSVTPSEPAPQPAAAPAEPVFNPQEFGYKFRTDTVYPKDRADAIELMQLGHSFRVNKPKWEEDRRSLSNYEARKEEYQRYDALREALQANPDFRSELETLAKKYSGQPSQPQAPQVPPEMAPVLETVRTLEQWKTQQEQREADNELARELDALEKSEPNYDWKSDSGEGNLRQQLLQYMSKNRVYNPEIAFAGMMRKQDLQRVEFEARKKAEEDAAKARKAGVVAPGTAPAPAPSNTGVDPRRHSYDELENLALESLGRR